MGEMGILGMMGDPVAQISTKLGPVRLMPGPDSTHVKTKAMDQFVPGGCVDAR
jgi:hypothetical protein